MAVGSHNSCTIPPGFLQKLFRGGNGGIALVVGIYLYARLQVAHGPGQFREKFLGIRKAIASQISPSLEAFSITIL